MNIGLIGYGKMGKAIEEIALQRGHIIAFTIDVNNQSDLNTNNLIKADVAIEFTGPKTAYRNVLTCMQAGTPLVCGSTGWLQHLKEAQEACTENNTALLVSSNFSIGVTIFFEINKRLAQLMEKQSNYKIELEEVHHTQKLDAPSGTAITLAEQVLEKISRKKKWINQSSQLPEELPIISKRIDPVPGTHIVSYKSEIDDIEIIHTAHNRKGFATGAVLAAEFLAGKKGIFTINDVLGL